MKTSLRLVLLLGIAFFGFSTQAQAIEYEFIDLGTLPNGNGYTVSSGINNHGQVVGESNVGNVTSNQYTDWHAFVYTPAGDATAASIVDLGVLPGSNYSFAQRINDSGQIVGYSSIGSVGDVDAAPPDTHFRAVAWTSGGIQDLGSLPGSVNRSFAHGINSAGQIVGSSRDAANTAHACVFTIGSAPMDKGTPAGGATAFNQVNDSGVACGFSVGNDGNARAFRYNLTNDQVELLPNLPNGGVDSYGIAINASGTVAGTGKGNNGNYHAVAWIGSSIVDLTAGQTLPNGHIYSEAQSINLAGVITGFSSSNPNANYFNDPAQRAFIYKNGRLTNLNVLAALPDGYILRTATGINDEGQITGFATTPDGKRRAYLLNPVPPVITSPLTISATAGQAFTYQIVASNGPTSYNATNLPAGLSVNTALGVIIGTPSAAGTKQVTISATNGSGTTTAILTITVQAAPASGPVITTGTAVTARAGQPFSFQIRASGVTSAATITASGLPSGLTIDSATGVISGTIAQAGSHAVTLTVTDGNETATGTLQLTFTADPAMPVITSPTAANVQFGQSFSYTITAPSSADPSDPTTYSISGTLPEGLVFDPNTGTISGTVGGTAQNRSGMASPNVLTDPSNSVLGTIQIFARNSHGTATTSLTFLTAKATTAVNIATRMTVGTGDNVLFGGFIVTGTAPKKVILRAIAPSLKVNGTALPGALQDTILELHGANGLIATNDDWKSDQQQAIIDSTIPPDDDRESAIVTTLPPALYTAILRGKNNTTGIGVVEVYDLDSAATSQLANISSRGKVLTGDDVMIGGFILSGSSAAKILVRAIGPELTQAGVPGALQDTTLELFNGSGTPIASNDDWKSHQQQDIIDTTVPPTDDREAAILSSLTPGNYTAIVRGKDNTTGVALVEVYVLQ